MPSSNLERHIHCAKTESIIFQDSEKQVRQKLHFKTVNKKINKSVFLEESECHGCNFRHTLNKKRQMNPEEFFLATMLTGEPRVEPSLSHRCSPPHGRSGNPVLSCCSENMEDKASLLWGPRGASVTHHEFSSMCAPHKNS